MPDAEFETMVKSILVDLAAKDKNLSEEHHRMYSAEVAQHRYQFERQQQECEVLKTIKKEEWQKHFEDLTHTELRRVDFRYNSETHKEQEATSEFKFANEKRHESIDKFKGSMQWFDDQIKQRYAAADFKL
jgi:secreted Zn-dependent insulinase-like peptidase